MNDPLANTKLISGGKEDFHVSDDIVAEFEAAIPLPRVHPMGRSVSQFLYLAWKTLRPVANPIARRLSSPAYFMILMNLDRFRCLPYFLRGGQKSVYLFDAWPKNDAKIREFAAIYSVDQLFISSSLAVTRLQAKIAGSKIHWIPEGVDPSRYSFRSYEKKDIDVLQFGRKYDAHHERIRETLRLSGKTYLYEKEKARIVFPSRAEFVDGLARARISICVPSSITHPERAGAQETMTTRFLQSMVSKCLILGHAPREMVELFGYNPVVEIDMKDPAGQILSLLEDFDVHIPLIEKNYAAVVENHTWRHRWLQISAILKRSPETSRKAR